jgi:hypothetical protein
MRWLLAACLDLKQCEKKCKPEKPEKSEAPPTEADPEKY